MVATCRIQQENIAWSTRECLAIISKPPDNQCGLSVYIPKGRLVCGYVGPSHNTVTKLDISSLSRLETQYGSYIKV